MRARLYANPLNRYRINSPMLPNLKRDADGGLARQCQSAALEIQNLSKMFTDSELNQCPQRWFLGQYVQRVQTSKSSPVCALLDRLRLGRFWILFAFWAPFRS